MDYRGLFLATLVGLLAIAFNGCQPQTTAQKIEDKAEDAGHEINQGVERAKENADR